MKKTTLYGLIHAVGLVLLGTGLILIGLGIYPDLVGEPKTYAKGYMALAGFFTAGNGCILSAIAIAFHGYHASDKQSSEPSVKQ